MRHSPSRRSFWFVPAAIAVLILFFTFQRQGLSQMASSGAKDQPARPLPRGMKAPAVDFRDVAAQAGLSAVVVSGELDQTTVVENTGTGVAIFDYDNDGLPDIFFVQGDRLNPSGAPLTPHLYHNLGGLRFEDVTEKAGIGHTGWGQGVCAGDADNEGRVDLFLTQWGHNVFLHNMGDGTFRDETRERGLDRPGSRWGTGCAFIDYDRDGWLDLAVAKLHRLRRSADTPPARSQRLHLEGHPRALRTAGSQGRDHDLVPQRWPRSLHRRHETGRRRDAAALFRLHGLDR